MKHLTWRLLYEMKEWWDLAKAKRFCSRYLMSDHIGKSCCSKVTCGQCKRSHHTTVYDPDYKTRRKMTPPARTSRNEPSYLPGMNERIGAGNIDEITISNAMIIDDPMKETSLT